MYLPIMTNTPVIASNTLNTEKCLRWGNYLMLVAFIVVTSSIAITFMFDQHFGIAAQVAAHIATIVFAGLLKIGYVLRCVALHSLGKRNF